jgi:hypothetical protein
MWRDFGVTGGILAGAVWLLSGCAHSQVEQRLDQNLAKEPEIENQQALMKETKADIDTSHAITEEQRAKLTTLRRATNHEVKEITEESLKMRSLLVKELVSPSYDQDMVNLIEKKLRVLEDKRLSVIFGAVEQVNQILGREVQLREPMVRDFLAPRG